MWFSLVGATLVNPISDIHYTDLIHLVNKEGSVLIYRFLFLFYKYCFSLPFYGSKLCCNQES
jgi:hypothetical protein